MEKDTRAALDELLSGRDFEDEFAEHTEARLEDDARALAERFKDRGFINTTPSGSIVSNIPTWMTGVVDGKVFYFRYRGDTATIRIGEFDATKAEADREEGISFHEQDVATQKARVKSNPDDGDLKESLYWAEASLRIVQNRVIDTTYPNVVQAAVVRERVKGQPYSATLNPGEAAVLIGDMLDEAVAKIL